MQENDDGFRKERSFSKMFFLGILANLSGIAASMSLGFSAVVIPYLKNSMTSEQISWFASIASLATPFGSIVSGPISDRFGRKSAIFVVNIFSFIGWAVIAIAYYGKDWGNSPGYPLLLLGRFMTGFSIGLGSTPATVYMAETSGAKYRSFFTAWTSIFISGGVLLVYILGSYFEENWGKIALLSLIFPCMGSTLLWFLVPESPIWLVGRTRITEARRSMARLYNSKSHNPHVLNEIRALMKETEGKSHRNKTFGRQFVKKLNQILEPVCLKPLVVVVTFFFFQQFSGVFVIVFYAINIVEAAGIQMEAYTAIILIGIIRLASAMLVSFLSLKVGRRPLALMSGITMTLFMSLLGGYLLLLSNGVDLPQGFSYVPLLLLLAYFVTSTMGFLTVPFSIVAEVFPRNIRGTASGLASGFCYIFNFVIVKIFGNMVEILGREGVFFFFGGMSLLGTLFVAVFLPETRGKTLDEIQEYFNVKRNEKNKENRQEICDTKIEDGK